MKKIITIFFLTPLAGFSYGQIAGLAIINDPDGYANLRKSPTTDSVVVSRLYNGQVFICEFDNNRDTDWADAVYTPDVSTLTKKQKNFYSDFIHPKDSIDDNDKRIISRKDSSCWVEGYIYRKEFTWLRDLPGIDFELVKDTIDKKVVIAQNDSIVLKVTQILFDPAKHKIVNRNSRDNVYLGERIDGKEIYGTDGIEGKPPIWQISTIELTIKGKSVKIPESAYYDLFETHLEDSYVSLDKRGNIYISMTGSDGAEAYNVVWTIRNGKYLNRYIDTSLD